MKDVRLVMATLLVGALAATITAAAGDGAPQEFRGTWKYQSFRPEPVTIGTTFATQTFVPFSPPGVLTIESDDKGTLMFETPKGKLKLAITIRFSKGDPAVVLMSASAPDLPKPFTNELHGWFVPSRLDGKGPFVVRGSIVQTSDSVPPKKEPKGTVGYFVLEKQ
jgi:hypothetical protein